ncbi:MAG: hypothetical protein AABY22_31200 [Nanoarchaeota archaeon]
MIEIENELQDKISVDTILDWAKKKVESKEHIKRELWIEMAFRLNLLRIDEAQLYNKMRQAVAIKKFEILKSQEKRSVAFANAEVETTDEYTFMRDQEDKIYSIDEFVRIAKKSSDINF